MRYLRSIFVWLMPFMLLSLQGCGGGNSNGTFTPVSTTAVGGNNGSTTVNTTVSGTLTLTATPASIDANGGQVLVTAKVVDLNGTALPNQAVKFSVVAGPASVDPNFTTVTTDSNGEAIAIVIPGNTTVTTNVIVLATCKFGLQTASAHTTFTMARGTGAITFSGSPYTNEASIDPGVPYVIFQNQIPFTLTDANGNPRPGVPVTLSVYSHSGDPRTVITVDYLADPTAELTQSTVTTDSKGQGIFNVTVQVFAPGPGLFTSDSIVFKAVTNDTLPLVAYAGLTTKLTETASSLSVAPQSSAFAAGDVVGATRTIIVAGGVAPYTATSSAPNLVSASVSGSTVTLTLQDASAWTQTVSILISDSKGQSVTATVTRQ
ncbi:MAG TPA: hypothetical protein VJ550_09640 [Geomonas sp.]|nr:hypothetical protein [Geomonas sp.]